MNAVPQDLGVRHGPWLPNVQTTCPSYRGPLIYGTGLLLVAVDRWPNPQAGR